MRLRSKPSILVLLVILAACRDNAPSNPNLPSEPSAPVQNGGAGSTSPIVRMSMLGDVLPEGAVELFREFGEQTTQPGEEVLNRCRSWTLNNETDLFVNTVHFVQNEGSHHSNFEFVPDTTFTGPDGFWDCRDRGYDFVGATSLGGILFAQSTQAKNEIHSFPEGAAIRIPAHSRVISDVHLINESTVALTGHAQISVITIPEAQVKTRLTPFHIEYDDLYIAAHSDARFTGICNVANAVSAATGQPFSTKLYYTIPHTHQWGKRVFLQVLGGPHDGQQVFEAPAYDAEGHGQAYSPPIDLTGASGFRFGCEYHNDEESDLYYGFGSGEMCEIFGFLDNAPFFWSAVEHGSAAGSEANVALFQGDCVTSLKPGSQPEGSVRK